MTAVARSSQRLPSFTFFAKSSHAVCCAIARHLATFGGQVRLLAWGYGVMYLLAVLAAIPYWRWLKLIP